jgi:zinc protease
MNTSGKAPARASLFAVIAALGWAVMSIASPVRAATPLFGAESFTLDNGIQVVLVPDHRVPVVTHMVWYRVGSADEPPGKSGIAHLLEHLMFKGTPANPGDTFTRTVQRLGGEMNAFTSYDYTGYFETMPAEHLETVMALEADRMTNLVLGARGGGRGTPPAHRQQP